MICTCVQFSFHHLTSTNTQEYEFRNEQKNNLKEKKSTPNEFYLFFKRELIIFIYIVDDDVLLYYRKEHSYHDHHQDTHVNNKPNQRRNQLQFYNVERNSYMENLNANNNKTNMG